MSEPITEIERRLSSSQPSLPPSLRADVQAMVKKNLRQQTFRDDVRWLAICAGILLMVAAGQWLLLSATSERLQDMAHVEIASTEEGRRLVSAFAHGGPVPLAQLEIGRDR